MADSQHSKQVRPFKDLAGQEFGRLTVLCRVLSSTGGATKWQCQCSCGEITLVTAGNLQRPNGTRSCGCLQKESQSKRATTHGLSRSPTYSAWMQMVRRCTDPSRSYWPNYGGRGIKLYEPWLKFENFLADMGLRPSLKHTIDRHPDNNGNYEPGNVRWATYTEQGRNRRTNKFLTYDGKTACISEWAEITGLSKTVIRERLLRGWTVEAALTTPARFKSPNGQAVRLH